MSTPFTLHSRAASDGSTAAVVRTLPASVPREPVIVTITPEGGEPRSVVLDLTPREDGIADADHDLVCSLVRQRNEGAIESLTFEPVAAVAASAYEARKAARAARRAARQEVAK